MDEFSEQEIKEFIDKMLIKIDEHYFYIEFCEHLSPEIDEYMNIMAKELEEQRISFFDYLNVLKAFMENDLKVNLQKRCDDFTCSLSKTSQEKLKHKYLTHREKDVFDSTGFSTALCTRIRILHDAKVLVWKGSLKKVMKTISEYWPENMEGSFTVLLEYLNTE
jgi:hypothetical protein